MLRRRVAVALALVAAPACGHKDPAAPDATTAPDASTAPDAGACPTARSLVYHGTSKPTYAPLTQGQILAIGSWVQGTGPGDIYCSGTLIAPRWVLTANHCGVAVGDSFCFGEDSTKAQCIAAAAVYAQPWAPLGGKPGLLDLTVVRLASDATKTIPGVEPIPLWSGDEAPLLGQKVEIAGYGSTESNTYNIRYFAEEMIDGVGPADDGQQWLRVDAMGARGPCDGDSGGPALVVTADCKVRVAGSLSWGDNPYGSTFCPGQDRYTRVDLAMDWITALVGSTDGACGGLDAAGTCSGTTATWCEGGAVMTADCAASACGWNGTGFRCVTGADPCGGVDAAGTCAGQVATWCAGGAKMTHDCAADTKLCVYDTAAGVTACQPDPCMGIDYAGKCAGNTLEYCDLGQLATVDCAASGKTCGYVAASMGYDCK